MRYLNPRALGLGLYMLALALPVYWLINVSFKTNEEITNGLSLYPHAPILSNYAKILTDPSWYLGYVHSITYVFINTVISIVVALPAAYAFSRYRFLGDKHLFFWLLSNPMARAPVYALPFFNPYSSIGLFDTPWPVALANCRFNWPLPGWILEGFISAGLFGIVAVVLVIMTALAVLRPEKPRIGIFRFATTRGDRLFMSLLGSAFIYILWFRFGTEAIWPPAVIALLFAATMFRFA